MENTSKRKKYIGIINEYPFVSSILVYGFIAVIYAIFTDGVMRDDAYIFFQYARNWANTGLLAFNPGEASFGITSIAWTALLAGGSYLISDIVLLSKLYGVIFSAFGAYFWAKWLFGQINIRYSVSAVAIAALLPAIGAGRMIMGMEKSILCLTSGLLMIIITGQSRYRYLIAGLISGLLMLIRLEMILFPLGIGIYLLSRNKYWETLKLFLMALATTFWWPIWLYNQTGSFLAPTRAGKLLVFLPEHLDITMSEFYSGGIIDRLYWGIIGFKNLAFSSVSAILFLSIFALCIIAVMLVIIKTRERRMVVLIITPTVIAALIAIYCFMFPLLKIRYFVWLTPPLLYTLYAATVILIKPRYFGLLRKTAIILLLITFVPSVWRQHYSTDIQQIRYEVAKVIDKRTPQDSRIALEPIGEIGYYSNRYIIDMGGLTDQSIQKYLAGGYKNTSLIWKCLVEYQADYLVTYTHDGFLGRLPKEFPDRFETIAYIPNSLDGKSHFRLLKILADTSLTPSSP